MKNKSLIPNIAVLLVVALVCVLTGQIYLQQQKDDVLYTENPNITGVIRLSDYNPNLKDTPGDVDIYVFDSGIPGGKALIYGGTHTNEVGSMLNAVTYLENVKCEEGTLYVMVRANNSGYSHTQPLLAQANKMTFQLSDGSTREFRIGTRISNPVHQWPDPNYRLNTSKRELRHDEIAEIRNLNRNHPGLEEGYLTEMVCYAIYNFIQTEQIDFIYDGHEAGAESVKLVNTLVVHENAMPLGSSAVMNCVINNLPPEDGDLRPDLLRPVPPGPGRQYRRPVHPVRDLQPRHGQLPRQGDRGAGEGRHLGQLSGHASGGAVPQFLRL